MTRAASGAQRSGAAALIIILRARRDYLALPREHFAYSFFAPRPPARWQRGILRASRRADAPPGSAVLIGPGGRTGNRLKCIGSVVLFHGPTRDVCADMQGRVRHGDYQNHRTSEPDRETYVSHEVSGSLAVLAIQPSAPMDLRSPERPSVLNLLAVPGANKQWGGYCLIAFAASSRPDQGLDGGAARRKFRGRARPARGAIAPIEAAGQLGERAGGNDGFPPFFEGAAARVGTGALECGGISLADQRLAATRCQPAGLASPCRAEGVGGRSAAEGGTPPSRAAIFLRPLAQPIFGVSRYLQIRCDAARRVMDRDDRKMAMPETGSGVSGFPCPSLPGRDRAAWSGLQRRVGDNGISLGRGRSRTPTLCGEGQGVN